ncbi:MAG: RecX family transcriptional regulator [Phycisphaerales bacterium]|nr:RecX family transcriptional regulator [Phycisphaerales bacterium]
MSDQTSRIDSIDHSSEGPNVCLVRAGRRRWRVRASEAEKFNPGDEVQTEVLDHAGALAKAHDAAMKLLARAPMSAAALQARLEKRFGADVAVPIVEHLTQLGVLNDAEAGRSLLRSLERGGPVGTRRLEQALVQHQIDPKAAAQVLEDHAQARSPSEGALVAARDMLQSMKRLDSPTQARRLAGRLGRRGFDMQTVQDTLDQLGLGEADSEYNPAQ